MLHKTIRESISKDDAKLLHKIIEWSINSGLELDQDRVNFLLAKLKRLSK